MLFRVGNEEMQQQHDSDQPDDEGGYGDGRVAAAEFRGRICLVHRFGRLDLLTLVPAFASMIAHGVGDKRHSHCANS